MHVKCYTASNDKYILLFQGLVELLHIAGRNVRVITTAAITKFVDNTAVEILVMEPAVTYQIHNAES